MVNRCGGGKAGEAETVPPSNQQKLKGLKNKLLAGLVTCACLFAGAGFGVSPLALITSAAEILPCNSKTIFSAVFFAESLLYLYYNERVILV